MIGNNELRVNEATAMAAFQTYLNRLYMPGKAPKVTGVTRESDNTFIVSTTGKKTT